jgi:hypothetical protein
MVTVCGKPFDANQADRFDGARGVYMLRTRKGNYIMVHRTKRSRDGYKAMLISKEDAVKWLVASGHANAAIEADPTILANSEV